MIIKVVTIPHTAFAAMHLVQQLRRLGHTADLVSVINPYSPHLHVIYGASAQAVFPRHYIVYQTEIAGSHFFTPRYLSRLAHALAVWDYHESNIPAYAHTNPRTCVVTPGYHPQPREEKSTPFLFYGWIEGSPRRRAMLDELRRQLPLRTITNLLGPGIWLRLSRAQVVINLHYHAHSPLERFRINEAMSHHCHVVSEGPADPRYTGLVHFTHTVEEIVAACRRLQHLPFTADAAHLSNEAEIRHGLTLAGIRS